MMDGVVFESLFKLYSRKISSFFEKCVFDTCLFMPGNNLEQTKFEWFMNQVRSSSNIFFQNMGNLKGIKHVYDSWLLKPSCYRQSQLFNTVIFNFGIGIFLCKVQPISLSFTLAKKPPQYGLARLESLILGKLGRVTKQAI